MRWTKDDVIAAAFTVLEREGLDKLTLRGVARELGAHLNSVSWYVKTKRSLIETMADTVVGTVGTDRLPADPVERVRVVVGRYRAAMLAHRDGGRLVAGTFAGTGRTLRVAEVVVAALLEAGYSEEDAARLCWALVYFTLGLTQEEQSFPPEGTPFPAADLPAEDYPALAKVGVRLMAQDPFDARFAFGLTRLLSGG
ncbi:TetR/AcrR family transcriptional regulator C-terminal domain-containing protein [Streptomyces sp. NPDC093252]|uniref:TetR/AcrR family transcriptional regulator C-terminal domain-containing protein n=1 Tax=Streptomyces sp. NPDC093252 TaxID=3154980 RepID=UPI0034364247